MEYRKIGKSDIDVSEISVGCWTMGGLNWVNGTPNGWADPDPQEIRAALKLALDQGVNHFDNADVYGNGKAERLLAESLRKLGIDNSTVYIATKLGHFPGTAKHAYEPAHIRHQCEQSLINLERDYLDIYYFHHGDFGESDFYLDDAVATMNALVDEGKVRVKGLSAYSIDDFLRLVPKVQPEALQSYAHILDDRNVRPGSRLVDLMKKETLSFVAFSPLSQGLLLDKYKASNPPTFEEGDHRKARDRFKKDFLETLEPKMAEMKQRFGSSTEDLASAALNFLLGHERVACVIPGFRNERQMLCNVGAAGKRLTEDDLTFIRDLFRDMNPE